MKSRGFLLVVLIAFLVLIDTCVAEKVCPERALPVETTEGIVCICTQGYYGENCQLKVLPLEENMKSSNQTDEDKCSRWYQCLADQVWFSVTTFFKTFFKDFEKLSFAAGIIVGVFASSILRAVFYAIVRFGIYCHGKKKNRDAAKKLSGSSASLVNSGGSVVIDIEPQEENQEDNSADVKMAELPEDTECASL